MPPSRPGSLLALLLLWPLALAAQGAGQRALDLQSAGSHDEARAAAVSALRANPDDSDASLALCLSLLSLGRPADAEVNARSGIARHRDARLLEVLGEACYVLGKNEEALRNLQAAVAAAPEGPRAGLAFYYMGETYLRQARFGHADMALTTALLYEPGKAAWWVRLGWAREKAGDTANALVAYEAALALDARQEDALLGKERLAARLGG